MAITAYTGVMGSGKSYEAVRTAALTALRSGRRLVTNVSGFNFEKVRDYLGPFKDGSMLEADKVLVIPSLRITQPNFFFDPDISVESIVKPGDLVLIDEVWAFWGKDEKLLPEHQKFFRMHRHYTESNTGISCDLVLMIQDLGSLHRFIRGVLEMNLRFSKMKSVGLMSRYQVVIYEGGNQRKASIISSSTQKYDKKIFPLYKSYDAGVGKESIVDARGNIFNNKKFQFVMVAAIISVLWGSYWFVGYMGRLRSGDSSVKKPASVSTVPKASDAQSVVPGTATPPAIAGNPVTSTDARLIGVVSSSRGESIVVLQLSDGRIVRQRMNAGVVDGWDSTAGYQGKMVGFVFNSNVVKTK